MNTVSAIAIAVGLIFAYPGWLMSQKAYFISRWRPVMAILLILLPIALAYPLFYLAFWLSKGQQVQPFDLFSDMIIYAVLPSGLLALLAYVMDHLQETPMRAMLAGGACFAIMLLPILFFFLQSQLQSELGITIKQ